MPRIITRILLKTGPTLRFDLGEEDESYGRVKSISFRKDIHKTVGHTGLPCYVVQFVNSKVQVVIPHSNMANYTTDEMPENDEDVGNTPDLPDAEEE